MSTIDSDLLREIEAFLAATGMTDGAFGKRVANDGKFLRRLRAGMPTIAARTVERVRAYIRENQPKPPRKRRAPRTAPAPTPPPAPATAPQEAA